MSRPTMSASLAPEAAQTATIALRGRVVRSGTRIRASYRWQPTRLVTAVGPHASFGAQTHFRCHVREALGVWRLPPDGVGGPVGVSQRLAARERPFLSSGRQGILLAESPPR